MLEEGNWRRKHNWEIMKLFGEPNIVGGSRLRWAGYIWKKNRETVTKIVYEKPIRRNKTHRGTKSKVERLGP